ncbi:MAG: hypothetical protein RMI91_07520 [Gemmatales bacterium]|nr:hypothetical protein [Gemmatales bacterium]MDW7994489.1 hypothetical protein [Gemmatales bacterium]
MSRFLEREAQYQSEDISKFFQEIYNTALGRPWTAREFPWLAKWLQQVDGAIHHLQSASKLPDYYCPLVSSDGQTGAGKLAETIGMSREESGATYLTKITFVLRLLLLRAMRRLGENDQQGARKDLVAYCRGMSRFAQGRSPCEWYTGAQMLVRLTPAIVNFANQAKLSAKELRGKWEELEPLFTRRPLWEIQDWYNRLAALDAAQLTTSSKYA